MQGSSVYMYEYIYLYVHSVPTWRKIRFAPDLPERNYKRKSGSVFTFNIILHLKT
jgi:hypothetical protein